MGSCTIIKILSQACTYISYSYSSAARPLHRLLLSCGWVTGSLQLMLMVLQ